MTDLRTRPVTEEEAAKLLCPHKFPNCVGSICSYWRWHKDGVSTVQETGVGFCGGGGPI